MRPVLSTARGRRVVSADEQRVHRLSRNQRDDADLHRSLDVLSCVEARREDFYQNHADQPDAVTTSAGWSSPHRARQMRRAERRSTTAVRDHAQGQRGGQRQHDGQAPSPNRAAWNIPPCCCWRGIWIARAAVSCPAPRPANRKETPSADPRNTARTRLPATRTTRRWC